MKQNHPISESSVPSTSLEGLELRPSQYTVLKKMKWRKDLDFFKVKDGKAYTMKSHGAGFSPKSTDEFVNKVKLFLKQNPYIFYLSHTLIGSSWVGVSAKKFAQRIPFGDTIINLGSGTTSVRDDVINIDFYPFKNVNFVSDITHLPFDDNTVDAIICECVMEHVPDPEAVVSEMRRVLKPGGQVYCVVPFVFSFHSSPYDFYRWSKMGLAEQFYGFTEVEAGVRSGAGAALNWVLAEYLAIILSFGSSKVHQILFMFFLVLFTPLCYLDYLIKYKSVQNIASHVYYIGRKK